MTTRGMPVADLAKDFKSEATHKDPSTIASLIAGSVGGALQVLM
jgi:hypothetical protein